LAKTKYPGVYKNEKTGRFFYNVWLGVDKITGKTIQRKRSRNELGEPFLTAKAAHVEATRVKNEYHKVHQYRNYKMTYDQYLKDIYISIYKGSIEHSTWLTRKATFEILEERFRNKGLRKITVEDCEMFRVYLLTESGYSQGYASAIYSAFRRTLTKAVQLQYIEKNPSLDTKAIPKGKAVIPYWTKTEFEQVLSKVYVKDFYEHMSFVALWMYYTTGMRVSEGLALTWDDVNFEKKTLRIHGTIEWIGGGKYRIKPYTKTKSSMRMITLDDDSIFILKKWKERQLKYGLTKFIFSTKERPLVRGTINEIIKRYADLAGVKRIGANGLRHSHASYLINQHNIDVLVISRRLGHSSPDITLKYYSHLWNRNDQVVADAITGDFNIKVSDNKLTGFYGNQYVEN